MSINYQALQQDPKDAARKAVHRLMRYSDRFQFIYELLQNADDAGKRGNDEKPVRMGFVQRDKDKTPVSQTSPRADKGKTTIVLMSEKMSRKRRLSRLEQSRTA